MGLEGRRVRFANKHGAVHVRQPRDGPAEASSRESRPQLGNADGVLRGSTFYSTARVEQDLLQQHFFLGRSRMFLVALPLQCVKQAVLVSLRSVELRIGSALVSKRPSVSTTALLPRHLCLRDARRPSLSRI